jgi:hypothetical protein
MIVGKEIRSKRDQRSQPLVAPEQSTFLGGTYHDVPRKVMLDFHSMPLTKEQLLGETEDLLRTAPPRRAILGNEESGVAWFGRFSAVIRAWNMTRSPEVLLAQQELGSMTLALSQNGYRRMLTLLNEARHTLRMETVGPLSLPLAQGQVFDYFDEVRKIIESAKQDLLFVDPYLDSEFVSRYLSHVSRGVTIRLLSRAKLATLLPAVGLFAKQSGCAIEVRSAENFHDRYVFVDRNACYQSGASFKDGAKSAPTTLNQITDAFTVVLQTYEDKWSKAKIEPLA